MSSETELLEIALGDPSGWERLTDMCLDRSIAEKLARALEACDRADNERVRDWASALEEMHPGLKVRLKKP